MGDISVPPAGTLRLSITGTGSPARSRAPEEVVISIAGDVDRCTAPALAACLDRLLGSAACATLTVDLARTDFLDVGGLNVLIAAAQRASAIGRSLRLVGCPRQALRLVRIAEAVELFESVAGLEEPVMAPQTLRATTCRPRPRGAVTSMRGDVEISRHA